MQKIAIRFKELRSARDLSQADVFEDTGINIGRLEQGRSNISVSNLKRLCEYFDLTIQEFFSGLK